MAISQNEIRKMCVIVGGQRSLARTLGINERTVRRWCAGTRECSFSDERILEAIKKSIKNKR